MPVCKYFLQGNCRYGNNCHFDHVNDSRGYQQSQQQNYQNNPNQFRYVNQQQQSYNQQSQSNRYSYNNKQSNVSPQSTNKFANLVSSSPSRQQQQQQNSNATNSENITNDREFLDFLSKELSLWLNSSAWKLSVYSFRKSAPSIPILEDISEEEVRYGLWEARRSNRLNEAQMQFIQKYNQAIETIKQMINPNHQIRDYLVNYFHECEKHVSTSHLHSSPQQQFTQQQEQKQNPFKLLAEKKQQQVLANQPQNQFFQQPQFAQPSAQPFSHQVQFTQQPQFAAQPQTQTFHQITNQPSFTNVQQQAQTITSFNTFSNQTQQFNPINNNSFLQSNTTFGTVISPNKIANMSFNNTQFNNQSSNQTQSSTIKYSSNSENSPYYTNINELNQKDIDEFKKNEFKLGQIPYDPPARELC